MTISLDSRCNLYSMKSDRRILSIVGLALVATTLSGCFNPFVPDVLSQRVTTLAPRPESPEDAVRLFEWCWVNRGLEEYKGLFTDDYVFLSALPDSAGNGGRDVITRRTDEMDTAENMFIGTAEHAPAAKITLNFDRSLRSQSDTRPNHPDSLYKLIRTSVDLQVTVDDGNILEVSGHALFYLVRGDVAVIPPELIAAGVTKDRKRWWIERWEDETLPEAGGASARRAHPGAAQWTLRTTMERAKYYFAAR